MTIPETPAQIGATKACPYSDRELLELLGMLLRSQIREERINSFEELRGLLRHVEAALRSPTPASRIREEALREAGKRRRLIDRFCGDERNGGILRDMAWTVWSICHNPTHEDGNADWSNDTLPIVNKAVEQLRAAILALIDAPQGGEDGWRPIETAPKDGTVIDVWLGNANEEEREFYCGLTGSKRSAEWHWRNGKFRPYLGDDVDPLTTSVFPTHWRPLPAPPALRTEQDQSHG